MEKIHKVGRQQMDTLVACDLASLQACMLAAWMSNGCSLAAGLLDSLLARQLSRRQWLGSLDVQQLELGSYIIYAYIYIYVI